MRGLRFPLAMPWHFPFLAPANPAFVKNSGPPMRRFPHPRVPHLLFVIFVVSGFLPRSLVAQNWKVLQSDDRGCTLSYTTGATLHPLTIGTRTWTRLEAPHAHSIPGQRSGLPDLKEYRDVVVLPGLSGHRVTVLHTDFLDTSGVSLLPVPSGDLDPRGEPRFEAGPEYSLPSPPFAVTLDQVGIARDRILGTLRIPLAQVPGTGGMLRVLRSITVRIDYGPRHPGLVPAPAFSNAINAGPVASLALSLSRMARPTSENPSTGSWVRIDITENGMYRLNAAWFRQSGIDPSTVDPRTIRIFNSGGRELPTSLSGIRPAPMQEIAIRVLGEEDGAFNENDMVLFFGRGLSGFDWDSTRRTFQHRVHRYDRTNSYLLTFGGARGKRVTFQPSLTRSEVYRPTSIEGRSFFEENLVNILQSGKVWVGKKLTPGLGSASSQVIATRLDRWIVGTPVTYRFSLYSSSDLGTVNSFQLSDQGTTIGAVPMGTVDFNTDRDDLARWSGVREFTVVPSLPDSRSAVTVLYTASNPDKNRGGFVDWVEWKYRRAIEPIDDVLHFSTSDTLAPQEFTVHGFSMSDILVWDVTAPADAREITGAAISGGTVRFQIPASERPTELLLCAAPAYVTPSAGRRITSSGLLSSQGGEFVIIAPTEFLDAARRLKAHRESGANRWSTVVAPLEDVYTEFSSGVTDPTAIRDFLAYAAQIWPVKAKAVLLLGDGHYDYLNLGSTEKIRIPVWESENSTTIIATYPTDDYYVQVIGNDARIDMAIGRIPAQSADEAMDAVSKIIAYETTQDFGPWRNRVSFVADDGLTSNGNEYQLHTSQSEILADHMPADIELKKIYLIAYPTENTAQGRRKPDVNQAIIDQINDGAVTVNYTGHGSEAVWAHEQVLVTDATIPQLTNANRLTFVTAATCTFGLYDRPDVRSGMERMVLKSDGGAIAGLASPRVVFSGQNSSFNESLYKYLFTVGRNADGSIRTLGEGLFSTKQELNSDPGYEKFILLGDPTIRLLLPRYTAMIDSVLINGVRAAEGAVQVRALSHLTFHGSVLDANKAVWTGFQGVLQASLFDAQRTVTVPEWSNWTYSLPGGLLYRGQSRVESGRFTVSFTVPKDISYENSTGRLAMYFDDKAVDGAGYTLDVRIGGTDSTAHPDDRGPVITLYLDTKEFHDGDLVGSRPLLLADLEDESGINTTGLGIGHNIEAWVDESEKSFVLNDFFTSELNSSQKGTVRFQLPMQDNGPHSLRLRAWDIYNNSSQTSITFSVASSADLTLANPLTYPNPSAGETSFSVQHNQSGPVRFEIKIYTMTGRMIRTLERSGIEGRFLTMDWDGRDQDGDRVANGIYFYKIRVSSEDRTRSAEAIQTLSIAR